MIGASEALDIRGHMAAKSDPGRRPAGWASAAAPAVVVGLSACLFYGLTIQTREAHVDEYYHLIAGQRWLQDGSFAILDGAYNRARLFTIMVAASMELFNRADLVTARIPSVIVSAVMVGIVFAWLRHVGCRWGAITAALLLGLAGYTLDVAHFARFYALHAAMIVGAAAALFIGTRPTTSRRVAWLSAAVLCLMVAMHVQPVTAIAAMGLAAWLALDQRRLLARTLAPQRPSGLVALIALGFAGAGLFWMFGQDAWNSFRHAERWAAASQDQPLYYLREYFAQMPLMTLFWPVAVVAGWRRNPSLAALCAIMTGLSLLLHSFAGMKAWRYAYYAFPFLCMTYGLAFDALIARRSRKSGNLDNRAILPAMALLALLVISSPVYRHTVRMVAPHLALLAREPARLAGPVPDGAWNDATGQLRRLTAREPLIVTGDDLRMLAHVGRFDIYISHSRLGELTPPQDFSRDFRTGRPLVDTDDGMSTVIDCNDRGLVIVSNAQWRNEMGVRPEVADLIERRATRLRTGTDFHIFRWHHKAAPGRCPYDRRADHAAGRKPSSLAISASAFSHWRPRLPNQSCPPATLGIAASAGAA